MASSFNTNYYGKNFGKSKGKAEDMDNRSYLQNSLEGFNMPEINISDIKEVVDRCSLYFTRCAEEGLRPTISGMCVWLGISRNTWLKWINGIEYRQTHQKACNRIHQIFDAQMEQYMTNNKINAVSGIFLSKNNFGYESEPNQKTEVKESAIQERSIADILKLAENNPK